VTPRPTPFSAGSYGDGVRDQRLDSLEYNSANTVRLLERVEGQLTELAAQVTELRVVVIERQAIRRRQITGAGITAGIISTIVAALEFLRHGAR
jgi:hypothetical protein